MKRTHTDASPTAPLTRATRLLRAGVRASLCLGALLCFAGQALADEVRLQDGRVLYGTTETLADGRVRVTTRDGEVTVAADQIVATRTDAELRASLATLADRTATSFANGTHHDQRDALLLARTAWRLGLDDETWSWAAKAYTAPRNGDDQSGTTAGDELDEFLSGLEAAFVPPNVRSRSAQSRMRRLLRTAAADDTDPIQRVAIARIMGRLAADDDDASAWLRGQARRATRERARMTAVRAILAKGERLARTAVDDPDRTAESGQAAADALRDTRRFLYRTAVLDPAASVRHDAAGLVADSTHAADAVAYLAPGLEASAEMRIRTAAAFADIGHASAVPALVRAAVAPAAIPAGSTRGHVAFLEQRAYIRDYDVEVAQAAFIADPKVDLVQSGVVLDATVAGTSVVRLQVARSYRRALVHLTGDDPGPRVAAWSEWAQQRSRD